MSGHRPKRRPTSGIGCRSHSGPKSERLQPVSSGCSCGADEGELLVGRVNTPVHRNAIASRVCCLPASQRSFASAWASGRPVRSASSPPPWYSTVPGQCGAQPRAAGSPVRGREPVDCLYIASARAPAPGMDGRGGLMPSARSVKPSSPSTSPDQTCRRFSTSPRNRSYSASSTP